MWWVNRFLERKLPWAVFVLLAAAAVIAVQLFDDQELPAPVETKPSYSLERQLRYSFTVQNKTSKPLQGAEFYIYAPVKQTSFQKALELSVSHPYELIVDESGNRQLRFKLDFPPFGVKVVSITATVALSEIPESLPVEDTSEYLGQQKYIELHDPSIGSLAARFSSQDPMQQLQRAYSWVAQNIAYAGYIEEDRGALYALRNKRGDCTEYMYLFAALARSQGVPTRGVGGFVIAEDALLKARDFHNWAEVYIDNKWRVVDPQHKKFLQKEPDYVAMRLLSERGNEIVL